jgi:intein-encoded DNA endonuclease-like protein
MGKDLKSRLSKEELVRLYKAEGQSLADIAKIYGVSRTAVMKHCNILGIERRGRGAARVLAQKKSKVGNQRYCAINEAFFSSWSPEMAYVLGLMMTDGCISKTKNGSYRISLCLNDGDLLRNVVKTMGSDHTVTESKYQKGMNVFIFGREKIAQDLLRLGMKPRKSLNLEFPNIPWEYLRDFIRGVFDGDGSVFYTKKSQISPLRCKFYSGSGRFILGLKKSLESLGMPDKRIYCEKKNRKNNYYYIRYSHKDSLKLFKIMYEGMKGDMFLVRKFNKFKVVIDSSNYNNPLTEGPK